MLYGPVTSHAAAAENKNMYAARGSDQGPRAMSRKTPGWRVGGGAESGGQIKTPKPVFSNPHSRDAYRAVSYAILQ